MTAPTPLLTVSEAAAYLAVSESSIYHRIDRRTIPFKKMGTGARSSIRFNLAEINAWLDECGSQA